jgi:hypothetical protein
MYGALKHISKRNHHDTYRSALRPVPRMGMAERGRGAPGESPGWLYTGCVRSVTDATLDPYSPTSLSGRLRAKRWELFKERFPDHAEMRMLDLGGTVNFWRRAPVSLRQVVTLNLKGENSDLDWVVPAVGDACEAPTELAGERFDIVFSNSVIEHVGGHARRAAFAETVHTFGERHWVQTPYRYFPLEPHWLFPGFQFLPVRARARVLCHWPNGTSATEHDFDSAVLSALMIELVCETAMRHYFGDSDIVHERVLGLTKSLIAVRD